jgi:hypothetical protein
MVVLASHVDHPKDSRKRHQNSQHHRARCLTVPMTGVLMKALVQTSVADLHLLRASSRRTFEWYSLSLLKLLSIFGFLLIPPPILFLVLFCFDFLDSKRIKWLFGLDKQ